MKRKLLFRLFICGFCLFIVDSAFASALKKLGQGLKADVKQEVKAVKQQASAKAVKKQVAAEVKQETAAVKSTKHGLKQTVTQAKSSAKVAQMGPGRLAHLKQESQQIEKMVTQDKQRLAVLDKELSDIQKISDPREKQLAMIRHREKVTPVRMRIVRHEGLLKKMKWELSSLTGKL